MALYALAVSVGFATLMIVRQRVAAGLPQEVGAVVVWQAMAYGAWLPIAALASLIFRRNFFTARALVELGALGGAALSWHALLVGILDAYFSRGPNGGVVAIALERLPIDVLSFTAIVCAAALLFLYRQQAVLTEALDAARRIANEGAGREPYKQLLVSVGKSRVTVAVELIESIAAAGNYVVVTWLEHEGLLRGTLASIAELLDPAVFVRVHRSTIANLTKVLRATPLADGSWRLEMRSGAQVVVSRTYRDLILLRLGQRKG